MANLSAVVGTETVFGTEQAVKTYHECMVELNNYEDYGHFYDSTDDLENPKQDFWGTGRWNFTCNLESFESWYMKDSEYDSDKQKHTKEKLKEALKCIDCILFDFVDYEPCMGLFYQCRWEITFKSGMILSNRELASEPIPLTRKNRIKYGFEDEEILSSDLQSLKLFNAKYIPSEAVRTKFSSLTDDQLVRLSDALGFVDEAQDFFTDSSDFWECYGGDISDILAKGII